MTSFSPDYFIHAANILLLVAYSVRDILWLRLFCRGGRRGDDSVLPLAADNVVGAARVDGSFAVINLLQSLRLFAGASTRQTDWRRKKKLDGSFFKDLPPRKVLQVLSIGSWVTVQPGERMIESGKIPDAVSLIVSGKVRVTRDRDVVGVMGAGQLVGSALILSGLPSEVGRGGRGSGPCNSLQVGTLERYLNANPDTRTVMQRHLARDLAMKVTHLAGGSLGSR